MADDSVGLCHLAQAGQVMRQDIHLGSPLDWTSTQAGDAPAPSPGKVRHVMCAVDFGLQSAKALRWAADFA